MTSKGRATNGTVEASSQKEAAKILRQQGLWATTINREKQARSWSIFNLLKWR